MEEIKLPKDIYFYWGNKTMSFFRYLSLYSFKKLNPDWNVTLIVRKNPIIQKVYWEEKPDFLYFKGEDCFNLVYNLNINIKYIEEEYPEIAELNVSENHVSDIILWKILSEKGGIVSDTDILYCKPIDYEKIKDVDVGIISFKGKKNYIPLSFMLGKPNGFFQEMYEKFKKEINPKIWDNSPYLMNSFESIRNKFKNLKILRLPSKLVFPFSETEKEFNDYFKLMFEDCVKIPESIGIHWYGANPNSQMFNNKLTKDNYRNYENTICKIIQRILKEKVSVIVPVYNQKPEYFEETIKSIINQTRKPDEIIIVDDGSEPPLSYVLPDTKGIEFKNIRNKNNIGIGFSRQKGVDEARGDYIAFLSSDDIWDEKFLEIMMREAEKQPNKILYSSNYHMDKDGQIMFKFEIPTFSSHEDFCIASWSAAERNAMFVNFSAVLIPKEVFKKVQFDKDLRYCEDLDFLLRSMKHFEYFLINYPLLRYRAAENLTSRILDKIPEQNKIIRKKCEEYWNG